jgi:hypothetical protein
MINLRRRLAEYFIDLAHRVVDNAYKIKAPIKDGIGGFVLSLLRRLFLSSRYFFLSLRLLFETFCLVFEPLTIFAFHRQCLMIAAITKSRSIADRSCGLFLRAITNVVIAKLWRQPSSYDRSLLKFESNRSEASFKSLATISRTSCGNPIWCFQPSLVRALAGLPNRISTSVGRK